MVSSRIPAPKLRVFTALTSFGALLALAWFGWGFGDEHARTRYAVMEGIAAAKPLKHAIADYRRRHGGWPDPQTQGTALLAGVKPDRYVAHIDPAADGHVLIVYKTGTENPHPEIDGHSIELAPHAEGGTLAWDCRGGDMPDDYRPTVCRAQRSGEDAKR